jgi:uncharacterized protein YndB with AHSA1/START domain
MTHPSPARVRVTHTFAASAERVYDAWLDPARLGRWLFATPTGEMVRVEVDARVGGSFNITERRDGEDVAHVGEYVELDRPRRIVFLLSVPKYSSERGRVEIDIRALASGCELTLTHEVGAVDDERAETVRGGWAGILELLATTLE